MNEENAESILASTASPPLALRVARPENGSAALPTPGVVQASAGVLNLDDFQGDADVRVASWPLIAEGQTLWLRVHGQRDDGTSETITLRTASPVTRAEAANGIHAAVDRSRLDTWKDDSPLTVEMGVNFKGGVNEAEAISFRVLRLQLLNHVGSISYLETFNDRPLGPVSYAKFQCFSFIIFGSSQIVSAPSGMTGRSIQVTAKTPPIVAYFLIDFLGENNEKLELEYLAFDYSLITSHGVLATLGQHDRRTLIPDGKVHRCEYKPVLGRNVLYLENTVANQPFTIYLDNLEMKGRRK